MNKHLKEFAVLRKFVLSFPLFNPQITYVVKCHRERLPHDLLTPLQRTNGGYIFLHKVSVNQHAYRSGKYIITSSS